MGGLHIFVPRIKHIAGVYCMYYLNSMILYVLFVSTRIKAKPERVLITVRSYKCMQNSIYLLVILFYTLHDERTLKEALML